MAIAQQLQGEGTSQTNTGSTESVTLSAGSNRYMVVALVAEHATSQAAPTSVTYGGNALALITDGTVTASQTSTLGGVFMYRLLEANMPANGANNLVVAWPSSTNYVMGWWILTGVEQANADDVKILAQTTTATSITVTLDAGNTTDAVICAAYSNNNPSTAITISGAAVTEDFDIDIAGTARGAAGTDLPAVASGTIACVATTTSTNRRIIVAIRIAEAAVEVDVGGSLTMGKPTLNAAPGGSIALLGTEGPFDPDIDGFEYTITVPADTTLMAVFKIGNFMPTMTTRSFEGVTLDVADNTDEWVQIVYMLNPPIGASSADALVIGPSTGAMVLVTYWSNVASFQAASAVNASGDSVTLDPDETGALCLAGIGGDESAVTPDAGVTEIFDGSSGIFAGRWVGYRLASAPGTVSVGGSTVTNADTTGAVWLPAAGGGHVTVEDADFVDAGGSLTMSKPTISGNVTVEVVAGGSLTMSKPTLSGTASPEVVAGGSLTMGKPTLSASASPEVAASGSLAMGVPTLSGTALVEVVAGGSLDMSKPTLSGTVTLVVEINAGGSMTVGKPTLDGSATVEVVVGGSLTMPVPTLSGSASPEVVAGGSLAMSVPTLSGSASIPGVADVGGSLTLGKPTLSGLVAIAVTAGGSLVMGKPTLSGRVVDPNAVEPRPGAFVTVVVPHGAAIVQSPVGAVVAVTAHGRVTVNGPSGGVS